MTLEEEHTLVEAQKTEIQQTESTDTNNNNNNKKPRVQTADSEEDEDIHPDYKDDNVPLCLFWTEEQVADWVCQGPLKMPKYRDCFLKNHVTGRRLIFCDASNLPRLGITDWVEMKAITAAVRDLLMLEQPEWTRSISIPPHSDTGLYEEVKSVSGKQTDELFFELWKTRVAGGIWQPPLSNVIACLPREPAAA